MLQLSYLDVRDNKIVGSLPSIWSKLEQVSMLLLHLHHMTTTLPPHDYSASNLFTALYSRVSDGMLMIGYAASSLANQSSHTQLYACTAAELCELEQQQHDRYHTRHVEQTGESFELAVNDRLAVLQASAQSQISTAVF